MSTRQKNIARYWVPITIVFCFFLWVKFNGGFEGHNFQPDVLTTEKNNIRSIVQACLSYAAEHDDMYPATLQMLVDEEYVGPEAIINTQGRMYNYIGGLSVNDVDAILIEGPEVNGWIMRGFSDGHVEVVRPVPPTAK